MTFFPSMRQLVSWLIVSLCAVAMAQEPYSDAAWAALKAEKKAMPRVIANNDGCDATAFPPDKEVTAENLYSQMLDYLDGTSVTTVSYCPFAVGFQVSYPSQVTDSRLEGELSKGGLRIVEQELIDKYGKDSMALAQDYCRAKGYEFFGCMRMNDEHDMYFPQWFPKWKAEHPECLFGTEDERPLHGEWTAYDYGRPEVRDRMTAILREMMERYDLDGLELDFYRTLEYFKAAAWNQSIAQEERDGMTAMMRTIRADAERIGRAKGRPILIAARLPEAMEVCRYVGLEVEQWLREGLIDIFIGGGDRGHYLTAAETAALCAKYGVEYCGGISDAYNFSGVFDRNTVPAFNGEQLVPLAAGAKSLYYFDIFYFPHIIKTITNDARELQKRDKSYFISHQHENNWGLMGDGYKPYNRLPELSPYRKFFGARCKHYVLQVGDDFGALSPDEWPTLSLYADIYGDPSLVTISLNGVQLHEVSRNGCIIEYAVSPTIVRCGANDVLIDATRAKDSGSGNMTVMGENVHAGRLLNPWQYLFAGHRLDKDAKSTMLPDGEGARYVDRVRLPNGMVNVLYRLAGLDGAPLGLDFELKVFPQSEADGAVLRLADGRNVEYIDFSQDQIRLRFAGLAAPFVTTDGFHKYSVRMQDGTLRVTADGNDVFGEVKLDVAVGDPRTALAHHGYLITADAETNSFLIGSMTGPGVGETSWKNIDLKSDMILSDMVLTVKYPPMVPETLKEAVSRSHDWDFNVDFSDGAIPQDVTVTNSYRRASAAPEGQAGVLLDNEAEGNLDGWMKLQNDELVSGGKRFRAVEWAVTPVRASKADSAQIVFQMVLRPQTSPGQYGNFYVENSMDTITTPWGVEVVPAGSRMHFLMVEDLRERTGVVYLNGKLIAAGELEVRNEPPFISWGDGSSGVGGAVVLEFVRIAAFD